MKQKGDCLEIQNHSARSWRVLLFLLLFALLSFSLDPKDPKGPKNRIRLRVAKDLGWRKVLPRLEKGTASVGEKYCLGWRKVLPRLEKGTAQKKAPAIGA